MLSEYDSRGALISRQPASGGVLQAKFTRNLVDALYLTRLMRVT